MSDLTAVSLFAGIGGFDLALKRCGIPVVAAVEIDPDCRGVLARHFPETRLFSDVAEVTGEQLRAAGFVPGRGIITSGWPCQGNSVAGRRGGMGDPRSGLWRHVVRLLAETRPAWFIGENVPGLLSVNGGADIAVVRRDLARLGYWWAERILDSQFFGVAQRRQRLFFVGCPGDRISPVEVLLEPEGGTGDPAPGGEARADTAGAIAGSAGGAGTVVANALTPGTHGRGTSGYPAENGHLIPLLEVNGRCGADDSTRTGTGIGKPGDPMFTLQAGKQHAVATLQGGGRRSHRIDVEGAAGGHLVPFDTQQITSSENRANPRPGDPSPTLNQRGRVHVADTAYALTSRASRASREETYVTHETSAAITAHHGKGPDSDATNGLVVTPVAVRGRDGSADLEPGAEGDPAFALRTDASEDGTGRGTPLVTMPVAATLTSGRATGQGVNPPGRRQEDDQNLVPMAFNPQTGGSEGRIGYGETPTALQASQVTGVQTRTAVRRLTPMECERLQALPDEWTRWKLVHGELVEQSDSARYREIGNAVTSSVVRWIVERLVKVDGM